MAVDRTKSWNLEWSKLLVLLNRDARLSQRWLWAEAGSSSRCLQRNRTIGFSILQAGRKEKCSRTHYYCYRQVLEDLELLPTFTSVLHVPNITEVEDLVTVLEETNVFSATEIKSIMKSFQNKKVYIGIKKLLAMIDLSRQTNPQTRVTQFLTTLQDQGCVLDL